MSYGIPCTYFFVSHLLFSNEKLPPMMCPQQVLKTRHDRHSVGVGVGVGVGGAAVAEIAREVFQGAEERPVGRGAADESHVRPVCSAATFIPILSNVVESGYKN